MQQSQEQLNKKKREIVQQRMLLQVNTLLSSKKKVDARCVAWPTPSTRGCWLAAAGLGVSKG